MELSESVEFPGDSFYAAAENSMRSEATYPTMNPMTALSWFLNGMNAWIRYIASVLKIRYFQ